MVTGEQKTTVKTSVLLRELVQGVQSDQISVVALLERVGTRSFGGLIILLAIVGLLPGIGLIAGIGMIVIGTQLVLGFVTPRLPRFVQERSLDVDWVKSVCDRTAEQVENIERWAKPRWLVVSRMRGLCQLLGLSVIALGAVVLLPLPMTQLPPGVALVMLSLGLLERDGVLILLGLVIGLAALALGSFLFGFALESVTAYLQGRFAA